jgi:peptide/nickel transport system substrate-binding protein
MLRVKSVWWSVFAVVLVLGLLLSACAPATPQVIEKVVKETVVVKETAVVEKEVTKVVEKEVTKVVEKVVTPTPEKPVVGGKLIIAIASADTLDPHMSGDGNAMLVSQLLGATLVAKNLEGKYIPYLAESWKSSADGLTWDFALRKDVKFHNGTPMTAKDYVWTIQRLLDPATKATQAGRMRAVTSVEAVDDYTLRMKLGAPYPVLLEQLSNTAVVQPLSKAAVEKAGDQFGRQPVGVGPYVFKEWRTGERIVIERNPDYKWGPAIGQNTGPYYIQTIEFRILPEPATVLAALEAGDVDFAPVQVQDLKRVQESKKFQIIEALTSGHLPSVYFNLAKPVFADLRVRQALNAAVDRNALIKIVAQGAAVAQYGPLSPDIPDYWPGVEYVSVGYDVNKAKALLKDAGYAPGSDGIMAKGGQPLKLTMDITTAYTKLAEVLQEQFKAIGVDVKIQSVDPGVSLNNLFAGTYEVSLTGMSGSESDLLYRVFHATRVGALNVWHHKDAEFDKLLDATRATVDPTARLATVQQVQEYIVKQSYFIPLYSAKYFNAVNVRVRGVTPDPRQLLPLKAQFNDAYIKDK